MNILSERFWSLARVAVLAFGLAACSIELRNPQSPTGNPPISPQLSTPTGSGAVAVATPSATPRPAQTPTLDPARGIPSTGVVTGTYTIRRGDTLGGIAAAVDMDTGDLQRLNGISNPGLIQPGQTLFILESVSGNGPSIKLIPDSELVNGPAAAAFDASAFIAAQPGYLKSFSETVDGVPMDGARIVARAAELASVNPRVLLALLEYSSGWLSDAAPAGDKLHYPLGNTKTGITTSLFLQLQWATTRLNEGYYGWRLGTRLTVRLADGGRAFVGDRINAGTAAVQNYLAATHLRGAWLTAASAPGFVATYHRLFGDPWQYDLGPPVPPGLAQPALGLPWRAGETWFLTGGPHASWAAGTPWGAIDFASANTWGCRELGDWVTAMAPGVVARSGLGDVAQSLDPSGDERIGWSVLYLHIGTPDRVARGTQLKAGDLIGHPSCEGGLALGAHVHVARKHNGEWLNAAGDLAFTLAGWRPVEGVEEYDGGLVRGGESREACECKEADKNGLTAGQ